MLDLATFGDALRRRSRDREPPWLTTLREGAFARFGELGLPTRRQENWRYTNLRALEQQSYPPATGAPSVEPAAIADYQIDPRNVQMVFVNGREDGKRTLGRSLAPGSVIAATGALIASPDDLLEDKLGLGEVSGNQPFVALNAALFHTGFSIILPASTAIDRAVEILHWGEADAPFSCHTRNLVDLGPGSSATIIESFAGKGKYWTNDVTQIRLGEGASLRHVKLLDDSSDAIHTELTQASLASGARYESFTLTFGGRLSRTDTNVTIDGAKVHCAVNGAYLLRGGQEATTATFIDHKAPGSETREVFKGVVEDRAHGVFQGKILVRQAAQKTDAHQLNRNLLLSPRAAIDTKPELEIYADDVKCSHGATVGDLDEAALFYLRTRGISEIEARRMLIEAFAADAIDLVSDGDAKTYLRRHLDRWLAQTRD